MSNMNIPPLNGSEDQCEDNNSAPNTEVNSGKSKINPDEIKREAEKYFQSDNADSADIILKKYNYLQITDSTAIPAPITIIKIGGESISTQGNVTTVSGAPKSAKSAIASVFIAGAIAEGEYDGFDGLEVLQCNGKAVLHFDSEQARHQHQKNLRTILKRVKLNSCPPNLLSYNIRQEEIEKYKSITEEIFFAASKKFGGIHLAVIDGGADYIRDVNDPDTSNDLVKFFEDLAIKYAAVVIVIVHLNPNTEKERGHFGSQLQRKSESILTVRKQGEVSSLEPKLLRCAGDLPLIQFAFDKQKGYHVYCGVKQPVDENLKDIERINELRKVANDVFAPPLSLSYDEAIKSIMKYTRKGETVSKNRFKEMRAHDMILQGEDKNWRLNLDYKQV